MSFLETNFIPPPKKKNNNNNNNKQTKRHQKTNQQLLLLFPARYNSADAVKELMERGADPSITNADGETPLHFAARRGNVVSAETLLNDVRSVVDCPDNSGVTPFHMACASGNLKLCQLFLEHKANIRALTLEEKSPLHFTATHGHTEIAELLLSKGWEKSKDCYSALLSSLEFRLSIPSSLLSSALLSSALLPSSLLSPLSSLLSPLSSLLSLSLSRLF